MDGIDMQHQMMGYDRAATMFSPDGHILQVEYAEKTVRLGVASIGVVFADGVLIISDKRIKDTLVKEKSVERISEIDSRIMATIAGIVSDGRMLIERAQVIAQQHQVTYNSPIDIESVIKDVSNIKQQFTQYAGARPFGVSVMVAGGVGEQRLFVSDVTGNYLEYKATAIGENDEKIKEILRKKYKENMKFEEAVKMVLGIFKEVLGKNFDIDKTEIAYILKEDNKIKRMSKEELRKIIK